MSPIARRILPLSSVIAICAFLSACSAGSISQTVEQVPNDSFETEVETAAESMGPTTCVPMGEGARCFVQTDGAARRAKQRASTGSRRPTDS
ncbi:MAG TPA: hypothetical protein VGN82_20170 [Bosea sp. (in: a-proteobacteria)]|jgi:hypothetical protein|uniref:hypothetical protein n=1 Tax=Bosea sp. (in: a-proteobacteria) TaxID=1871050 RepID=UPI002E12986C|nr:hypothetical protein [Bosea sp. (in: a-proteobacteria)]